jgi:voltage-gated potassium channel
MMQVIRILVRKVFVIFSRRRILIYAGGYMLLLWLISTIIFSFLENHTLVDSFYWAVTTTTTVGYGDVTPQTVSGKILAMVVMLSGIGVLGAFLATFADVLIEESLKRRRKVRSFMESHVVVFGWNKKVEIAVKELLQENLNVVLLADVDDIPLEDRNLTFIKGDITNDEDIGRTNVGRANSALISGTNDTETLLTAIAVKKFNDSVRVTCIVSDPKVKSAMEKVGVDQVLSTDEFFGLALSRSVIVPSISHFLNELMSTKGMDLYQDSAKDHLIGKTFGEAVRVMKEKYNAILIGLVRGEGVLINPDAKEELKAGDGILYISRKRIDGY